tara:strand:- start:85 stop:252 length:168 start_codon:yes stop_codon:yes gene_type:complete
MEVGGLVKMKSYYTFFSSYLRLQDLGMFVTHAVNSISSKGLESESTGDSLVFALI